MKTTANYFRYELARLNNEIGKIHSRIGSFRSFWKKLENLWVLLVFSLLIAMTLGASALLWHLLPSHPAWLALPSLLLVGGVWLSLRVIRRVSFKSERWFHSQYWSSISDMCHELGTLERAKSSLRRACFDSANAEILEQCRLRGLGYSILESLYLAELYANGSNE